MNVCRDCIHLSDVPGSAEKCCIHPKLETTVTSAEVAKLIHDGVIRVEWKFNPLQVSASVTAVRQGWFQWPLLFDPVWVERCRGFERKEGV